MEKLDFRGSYCANEVTESSKFEILSTIRYDSELNRQIDLDRLVEGERVFDKVDNNPVKSIFFEEDKGKLLEDEENFNLKIEDSAVNIDLLHVFRRRFAYLSDHYRRIKLSFDYFKWNFEYSQWDILTQLIKSLPTKENTNDVNSIMEELLNERNCYKMRVLFLKNGELRIEAHSIPSPPSNWIRGQYFENVMLKGFLPLSEAKWNIFIDSEPLEVSPFTYFKTTNRNHYTSARNRMTKFAKTIDNSRSNEILLYNNQYQLLEGSITNVAVIEKDEYNNTIYITPKLEVGCLCGVMRNYLLKNGLITEGTIDIRSLQDGDDILIFNAIMGCVKGTVRIISINHTKYEIN